MGKSQYINLQDAALLSGKSPQTIRRLIKGNTVRYRKYKTPQGFTYLVEKNSLLNRFDEEEERDAELTALNGKAPRRMAPRSGVRPAVEESELVEEFDPASVVQLDQDEIEPPVRGMGSGMNPLPQERPTPHGGGTMANAAESSIVAQLIQQHREDKKRLFELLEIFQKRILTLEDQIKQLEAPKAPKRWWAFWR